VTEGKGSIAGRGPRDSLARGNPVGVKRAVVLAIVACSRREPIASCDDDLHGVYVAGDERWMMIEQGDTLEAYPLFPDGMAPDPAGTPRGGPAELIVAPRMFDFRTEPAGSSRGASASRPPARQAPVAGTLRRRYMRGAARCDAHVPVHITRCAGDTLELVLAEPSPPIEFSPCTWSRPGPSHLVRWRRE